MELPRRAGNERGADLTGRLSRWAHRNVVYPAIVRARGEGSVFKELAELRALERLPPAALVRRQAGRLAETLNHAQNHSPFYAKRWPWASRVSAEDAIARLAELPLITKTDLQESLDELIAQPALRRVTRKTTGGSTGQPVTVVKDREATAHEMAASWLGYGWFGVEIGDRAVRFWGSPFTLKRRLRFAAADLAMHRIRFSAFAFDEDDLERYWRRCLSFRPDYFYGYVSMIEAFADFVQRRGYDGPSLGLKSVITTSEVLSPAQRDLIRRAFGVRVQDEYGCGEVGPIAYECEEGRLHVMSENLVVELVQASGEPAEPGGSGEIVVTDLNNRAMPLIRYRLGDFGVLGPDCPCGRGFPVLKKIWGRAYDFVKAPDGRRYHGEFFMYLFEDLRAGGCQIGQFQITQESGEVLSALVVATEDAGEEVADRVRAQLREALTGMEVTVSRVRSIPREASGKMRVIRNTWLESHRNS